jgi:thiol:disulfide interchange protein
LSRHWITNATIGAIFVFFALSLFGMYEITLPQGLANFTSSREGRGGTLGTVFMALTFTVISFTCVAPFLGGFAGLVDSKKYSWFELALGAFAYSATFAAPFFVLALFPSMIKKLPKSGSWLNSVKVVMGFLELAAALKFFRTAELRFLDFGTVYFTYDLVLGIWVVLAIVCGLYLLNVFRFDHDTHSEHVGVMRVLLALAFFSLAVYIAPAMLKHMNGESQRPRGVAFAWIDSFLLPEPRFAAPGDDSELHWSPNLKGTVDEARKEIVRAGKRQFIFVDYTGVTCTNCQINERNVFTREDVRKLYQDYWLVQQYTDEVRPEFYSQSVDKDRREEEAEANLNFQKDRFGDIQLPLYVVIEVLPDKLMLRGKYDEGKINDVTKFLEFLRKSRE